MKGVGVGSTHACVCRGAGSGGGTYRTMHREVRRHGSAAARYPIHDEEDGSIACRREQGVRTGCGTDAVAGAGQDGVQCAKCRRAPGTSITLRICMGSIHRAPAATQ